MVTGGTGSPVGDSIRMRPFGERAVLVEVDGLDDVLALHTRLRTVRVDGVIDLVPAARTVLVVIDPAVLPASAARSWIARTAASDADVVAVPARLVEVPVVYDGEDLDAVAAHLGIPVAELIERHASAEWTVAFTGFAPGFGYLVSPDWPYEVPRLSRPRARVPSGAVALAGAFSGAYPRATPGGWQLIGTTSAPLFDPDAATPALLRPGDRVQFVPAPASASPSAVPPPSSSTPTPTATPAATAPPTARHQSRTETPAGISGLGAQMVSRGRTEQSEPSGRIRVIEPGLRATVQDQGRPGALAAGVASSGAADRAALRTANRLVGNHEAAAGVEITMGGFRAVWYAAASATAAHTAASLDATARAPAADTGAIVDAAAHATAAIDAAAHAPVAAVNATAHSPADDAAAVHATANAASRAPRTDVWFAVAGAWGAIHLDGARVDPYAAHRWPPGAVLHVDWFDRGARGYLAVRGGIDAPALFGSRATDTLAGLGPEPLTAESTLAIGDDVEGPIPPDDLRPWTPIGDELEIALAPGPRADRFRTLAPLFEGIWTVSAQADRVGIRLDGPGLERVDTTELASEGMLPGAIQVPPDGHPVILGPDGPVTGGYPVVAVVVDAARDALGQARPGTRIRFRHAHGTPQTG